MNLTSLVYVSSISRRFVVADLQEILHRSRENNARADITGLLLYRDGQFIQNLEGPEDAVDRLYRKIRSDPRHHRVRTVLRSPLDVRLFADWSMGFRNVDEMDGASRDDVSAFLSDIVDDTANERQRNRLYGLLRSFGHVMAVRE